jgi:hypothetical protein
MENRKISFSDERIIELPSAELVKSSERMDRKKLNMLRIRIDTQWMLNSKYMNAESKE